ncbi:hypothetical protein [Caminibacter sp.]
MAIAIKPTFSDFDFISLFNQFIENIVINYKNVKNSISTKELENKAQKIEKLVRYLNENIENIVNDKEFERLEDELIEMKLFLELNLSKFPKSIRPLFEKLYEALTMLIFNLSMYELKDVRDKRD